jgi:hypothetical protein
MHYVVLMQELHAVCCLQRQLDQRLQRQLLQCTGIGIELCYVEQTGWTISQCMNMFFGGEALSSHGVMHIPAVFWYDGLMECHLQPAPVLASAVDACHYLACLAALVKSIPQRAVLNLLHHNAGAASLVLSRAIHLQAATRSGNVNI